MPREAETIAEAVATHRRNLPMEEPIVAVEETLARHSAQRFALAHCSGTMALLAAYFGVGIGPGDDIVVPTLACSAVASPLLLLGARPVFADIDPDTLCISPDSVERVLTSRTRGICAVHPWGNVCRIDALAELARSRRIALIEDCSQAPGAQYDGRPVGSFGVVSVFSMQGSKALSGGEGGAIVTSSERIYNRILLLGHHGRIQACLVRPNETMRAMGETTLGLKLRPHVASMAAALLRLERLEVDNEHRRALLRRYDSAFLPAPGLKVQRSYHGVERGGFSFDYPLIYCGDSLGGPDASELARRLLRRGLAVKVQRYPPLHLDRAFALAHRFWKRKGNHDHQQPALPISECIAPRILSLPFASEFDPVAVAHLIVSEIHRYRKSN